MVHNFFHKSKKIAYNPFKGKNKRTIFDEVKEINQYIEANRKALNKKSIENFENNIDTCNIINGSHNFLNALDNILKKLVQVLIDMEDGLNCIHHFMNIMHYEKNPIEHSITHETDIKNEYVNYNTKLQDFDDIMTEVSNFLQDIMINNKVKNKNLLIMFLKVTKYATIMMNRSKNKWYDTEILKEKTSMKYNLSSNG